MSDSTIEPEPEREPGAEPGAEPEADLAPARRDLRVLAMALIAIFGFLGMQRVSMDRAMGWDEAMHLEWPAARMALALRAGEPGAALRAVHDCEQYPFVAPALQAAAQTVFGVGELVARRVARLEWALCLLGFLLLAREVARGLPDAGQRGRVDAAAPWLTLTLALLSPMLLAFGGTLFLEVPFVLVSLFALRAWLRAARTGAARDELVAGAWLAVAFFTKFNYGLLLGFALFLDLVVRGVGAARAGEVRAYGRTVLRLAAVPLVAFAWWFLLPLPLGFAKAASHRAALVAWLSGNTEFAPTPSSLRWMHWGAYLVTAPRVLGVLGLGILLAVTRLRRATWSLAPSAPVRALVLVLVAGGLPIWLHPFHLDRFLLPGLVPLATLGGVGLACVVPRGPRAPLLAAGVLLILGNVRLDADTWWLARRVGIANPAQRDYQQSVIEGWRDLDPDRPLDTNGRPRAELEAYLDLARPALVEAGVLAALDADDGTGGGGDDGDSRGTGGEGLDGGAEGADRAPRVGWAGLSQSLPPGAFWLGLHDRGEDVVAQLRRDDLDRAFVTLAAADPGWSDDAIRAWAADFDLLLATRPVNLARPDDPGRAFLERYQTVLTADPAWTYVKLGEFPVNPPVGEPYPVTVVALRPR